MHNSKQRASSTLTSLKPRLMSAVVAGLFALLSINSAANAQITEPKLRALTIVGILRYTKWHPPLTGDSPTLCNVGQSPSYPILTDNRSKIAVQGEVPLIQPETTVSSAHECDIIIVGKGVSREHSETLYGLPRLTICDTCSDPEQHAIHLFTQDSRVRFSVNLAKSKAAGVYFGSDMLELAAEVSK